MSARDVLAGVISKLLGEVTGIYDTSAAEDCDIADAILAAGYTKPRTIITAEELDALPVGAVILDRDGDAWQRMGRSGWNCTDRALNTSEQPSSSLAYVLSPATVLYSPEES